MCDVSYDITVDVWNEQTRHARKAINGKRRGCAWNDNPHVWVVGFEVVR